MPQLFDLDNRNGNGVRSRACLAWLLDQSASLAVVIDDLFIDAIVYTDTVSEEGMQTRIAPFSGYLHLSNSIRSLILTSSHPRRTYQRTF